MRCNLCGSNKIKKEHKWFDESEYSIVIPKAVEIIKSLDSCYMICTCNNCGEVWVEARIKVVNGYNGGI